MIHKHQHAYGENDFSFETFETYITEFTNFSTSWKASVDITKVNVSATSQHSIVISLGGVLCSCFSVGIVMCNPCCTSRTFPVSFKSTIVLGTNQKIPNAATPARVNGQVICTISTRSIAELKTIDRYYCYRFDTMI